MTTYSDTLTFLYSQLPMYQRTGPVAFKKGLGNIRQLLKYLDHPEKSCPAIHIAGTNGKGTVSHMLAACYQAGGRKVGLYTSPHYKDFRERIKIDGVPIGKREVTSFIERIRPLLAEIKPSFFEITVAMAFDAFRRHGIEIAVVETGLGGRLDSTNVLRPVVSVITNISLDHMQMLGNTLPLIAREKAGIIKRNTPVVIGIYDRVTAPVFRHKAGKLKAPLTFADRTLQVRVLRSTLENQVCAVQSRSEMLFARLTLDLAGPFQAANLATTLQTIRVLGKAPDFAVSDRQIRKGLGSVRSLTAYRGRWQVLSNDPVVLCDSAHNEAGLIMVNQALQEIEYDRLHLVLGFVQDKDMTNLLRLFPKDAQYYFARPAVPRGVEEGEVQGLASSVGRNGRAYSSVRRALAAAKRAADRHDLIFVGGSTFVVAEVL